MDISFRGSVLFKFLGRFWFASRCGSSRSSRDCTCYLFNSFSSSILHFSRFHIFSSNMLTFTPRPRRLTYTFPYYVLNCVQVTLYGPSGAYSQNSFNVLEISGPLHRPRAPCSSDSLLLFTLCPSSFGSFSESCSASYWQLTDAPFFSSYGFLLLMLKDCPMVFSAFLLTGFSFRVFSIDSRHT